MRLIMTPVNLQCRSRWCRRDAFSTSCAIDRAAEVCAGFAAVNATAKVFAGFAGLIAAINGSAEILT